MSHLAKQRSDTAFDLFYDCVVQEASEKGLHVPTLPRQSRIPRRINDGSENNAYSSRREFFRHQYYEILDLLKEKLEI